jgi:hypothetical protein
MMIMIMMMIMIRSPGAAQHALEDGRGLMW